MASVGVIGGVVMTVSQPKGFFRPALLAEPHARIMADCCNNKSREVTQINRWTDWLNGSLWWMHRDVSYGYRLSSLRVVAPERSVCNTESLAGARPATKTPSGVGYFLSAFDCFEKAPTRRPRIMISDWRNQKMFTAG